MNTIINLIILLFIRPRDATVGGRFTVMRRVTVLLVFKIYRASQKTTSATSVHISAVRANF